MQKIGHTPVFIGPNLLIMLSDRYLRVTHAHERSGPRISGHDFCGTPYMYGELLIGFVTDGATTNLGPRIVSIIPRPLVNLTHEQQTRY